MKKILRSTSKWTVHELLIGQHWEMCLLLKGKDFHKLTFKGTLLLTANPALMFVGLQVDGLSPPPTPTVTISCELEIIEVLRSPIE